MDPKPRAAIQSPQVAITLADFVSIDADGRVTLVGAGNRILVVDPLSWHSPPFSVWAALSVKEAPGHPAIVELVLAARDGRSVRMPDGHGGSKEVRLTQPVLFRPRASSHREAGSDELPLTFDIVATFASGLILEPGLSYRWQVEIEGRVAGTYAFVVQLADDDEVGFAASDD